jgi:hypothetical protein
MPVQHAPQHSVASTNLADLLERVLDKGIVIAGDIRIKLVDIELLTIQIRLVVCSVDRAREIGIDWWVNSPTLRSDGNHERLADSIGKMEERLAKLEASSSSKEPDPTG